MMGGCHRAPGIELHRRGNADTDAPQRRLAQATDKLLDVPLHLREHRLRFAGDVNVLVSLGEHATVEVGNGHTHGFSAHVDACHQAGVSS